LRPHRLRVHSELDDLRAQDPRSSPTRGQNIRRSDSLPERWRRLYGDRQPGGERV